MVISFFFFHVDGSQSFSASDCMMYDSTVRLNHIPKPINLLSDLFRFQKQDNKNILLLRQTTKCLQNNEIIKGILLFAMLAMEILCLISIQFHTFWKQINIL